MATVRPFVCVRPAANLADKIAALPYDVYNREEACQVVKDNKLSFLNIDRAETQFDSSVDTYDERVYAKAKELGCNKIALGHHKSDVIETTLMGMLYGGQMQGMLPRIKSTNFEGMELIRPMYCVLEQDVLRWKEYNGLQFIACACKFTQNLTGGDEDTFSARRKVKALIAELKKENANVENNIFQSIHNVQLDTLAEYKQDGVKHSFLEKFEDKE